MISLKQLNYALAVEKHLNFKRAAESCSVSPSAMSTALKELESHLHLKIFERDNKSVVVTPLGHQVLLKAKEIHKHVEQLKLLCGGPQQVFQVSLKLGAIPTAAPFVFSNCITGLKRQHSQFLCIPHEANSEQLITMVKQRELDAAIIASHLADDELSQIEFWREEFVLVTLESDKRFSGLKVDVKQIDPQQLLILQKDHCLAEQTKTLLGTHSTTFGFEGTSLGNLIPMILAGEGVSLLPEMCLSFLVNCHTELKSIRLNRSGPHRTLKLILRQDHPQTSIIYMLLEALKASLKSNSLK